MAAKKKATKKATKRRSNPSKKTTRRRTAKAAPKSPRRRRRRRNPDWGKVAKAGALALVGVMAGAIVWGGVQYVTRDIDVHPALRGGVFTIGGVLLAGLQPWQKELMLGAGGIIGALGVSEVASGVLGTKQGETAAAPVTVDARTMLPTGGGFAPQVKGVRYPELAGLRGPASELAARDYGAPASELANGDYGGIKVPDFLV